MRKKPVKIAGIDGDFYHVLTEVLPSWNFPERGKIFPEDDVLAERPTKKFFDIQGRSIFLNPYQVYKEDYKQIQWLSLSREATHELVKTHAFAFLTSKLARMDEFFYYFRRYCGLGITEETYTSLTSLNIYASLLANAAIQAGITPPRTLSSVRDHSLHQYNVFFLGLYLYINKSDLQEYHREFLENNQCEAVIPPNNDIKFQFFEQWFITASFHDLGYVFDPKLSIETIGNSISILNELLNFLKKSAEKKGLTLEPEPISLDCMNLKLDVGKLFNINYGCKREFFSPNFWEEKLAEINALDKFGLDHGIVGAKLLLKLTNIAVKRFVEEKGEVWARYSFRNYILPAHAIAIHNLISQKKLRDLVSYGGLEEENRTVRFGFIDKGRTGKIVLSKDAFKKDFLTQLLVACDELVYFDRLGAKDLIFGLRRKIEINDNEPDENHFTMFIRPT